MEQKVIKLTQKEELDFLDSLSDSEYIGCGSSRAVFKDPLDDSRVIKIAASSEGIAQNRTEIARYEEYGDKHLARIYFAGFFILIVEKIKNTHDDDDDDDDYDDDDGYDDEPECQTFANNTFGHTSDNAQYGLRANGTVVLYDYGYSPDEDLDGQVGSMGYWEDMSEPRGVVDFVIGCILKNRILNRQEVSRFLEEGPDDMSVLLHRFDELNGDESITEDRLEVWEQNDREAFWEGANDEME